ncbi:PQQ enzyme repeat-containing protein [Thermoplasmatales archaeon SCGC AB-540-F20]|nr:PQQ enzyme repeat-containing protein [Thermoplasmatales archaeon SCGC AB-540-F20]
MSAENGSIKWEFIVDHLHAVADTTPAIYDDVLYVASPNGYIYALNISNVDKPLWKQQVYTRGIGNFLVTSPAYAEGVVYIGTPTGTFYALDASDGEIKWAFETFEPRDNFAVTTSPIVSNGLVFFGDENGKFIQCWIV